MLIKLIQNGNEMDIVNYLNNNKISDEDIRELKSFKDTSPFFQDFIKKQKKNYIKQFLEKDSHNLKLEYSYILMGSYSKTNEYLKKEIFNELYDRMKQHKIKQSSFFHFISKNENFFLLSLMNKDLLVNYIKFLKFDNLSDEEEFKHYNKLQNCGLFEESLVTFSKFTKCFSLWDKKEKDIKKCFLYFDYEILSLLLDNKYKDKNTSLIEFYIKEHIKDFSTLFSMKGVSGSYHEEKIKEDFKVKLSFLCSSLKLEKSFNDLKDLIIDFSILEPYNNNYDKKISKTLKS